jgi:hypothetical protein
MPSRYTSTGRVLSLGVDDTAAWLALLQSKATHAWDSANVGLTEWPDLVQGVVATVAGATLTTLNGRPAVATTAPTIIRVASGAVSLASACPDISSWSVKDQSVTPESLARKAS